MSDQDQFAQLPHLTWRDDIILPIIERDHEFAHEGADHAVIYRDGVAVEQTGAGARVFTYTIPLREGLTKGPYGGLFSVTLMKLWQSFHGDKSPGTLADPIYGPITCVPQRWVERTDVNKRDGVDVQISFKEDVPVDGTSEAAPPSLDSLTTDAARLDEEVTVFPWPIQQPPPAATGNPLAIAAGIIQQGNYAVQRSKASVQEYAMRCGEIEDAAAEAETNGAPGAGVLKRDARRGRLQATRVASAPPRDVVSELVQITISTPKDLFTAAKDLGCTVEELVLWNPFLARSPEIAPGVRLYSRRKK